MADNPPVQRRLAAILAADIAGYSLLMGVDEAGTALMLREHRAAADPLVAAHGGRIVKTTGDGVLTPQVAPGNWPWRNPGDRELFLSGLRLAMGEET